MLALLDDSAPRWRDAVDLVRGLVVERARAMFEPADRPLVTYALFGVVQIVLGVAVVFTAVMVGATARHWLGALPKAAGILGHLMMIGVLVAFVIRLTSTYQAITDQRWGPAPPPFSRSAGAVWLGAAFAGVVVTSWAFGHELWHWLWLGGPAALQLSWRSGREMAAAVGQMRTARRDLKWALLEVERCKRLAVEGKGSPLREAREKVDRLTHNRDAAISSLRGMGYRARYQGSTQLPWHSKERAR